MNTPSNTPSIDARELFRLASLIGCEPEDEARHRADLKAFVDQYVSEREKAVDRFEVIDSAGRSYVKGSIYGTPVSVKLSFQDAGKTLKVFIKELQNN